MELNQYHYAEEISGPWEHWFSWYPVKIGRTWSWMEHIQRRPFRVYCEGRLLATGHDYRSKYYVI